MTNKYTDWGSDGPVAPVVFEVKLLFLSRDFGGFKRAQ